MKIFIYRKGALGDTISFIPFLFKLKETYKLIYFAGNYLYRELFQDIDFIRFLDADSKDVFELINNRTPEFLKNLDRIVFFSNIILNDKINKIEKYEALPKNTWFYKHPFDCLKIPFNEVHLTLPISYFPEFQELVKKKYIIIHPGSGGLKKVWHIENFFEIEKYIKSSGFDCIYILGEAETRYLKKMGGRNFFYNLSLKKVCFLVTYALIYLGCDSGISHLAGVLNVPGIVLFGESSEKIYRPWGKIKVIKSLDNRIESIKPEVVIKQMEELLENR